MKEARIRELEWAATFCKEPGPPQAAGADGAFNYQRGKLTPDAVLELIADLRNKSNLEPELAAVVNRFREGETHVADIRLFGSPKAQLFATISEKYAAGNTLHQEFRVL